MGTWRVGDGDPEPVGGNVEEILQSMIANPTTCPACDGYAESNQTELPTAIDYLCHECGTSWRAQIREATISNVYFNVYDEEEGIDLVDASEEMSEKIKKHLDKCDNKVRLRE